jgi:hypothetical protein
MGYPTDAVEIVGYLTLKLPHVSNENHLDAPTLYTSIEASYKGTPSTHIFVANVLNHSSNGLKINSYSYHISTSNAKCHTTTHANDKALLINSKQNMQP